MVSRPHSITVTIGLLAMLCVANVSLALAQTSTTTPAPTPTAPPPSVATPEKPIDMTSDIELTRAAIQVRRQAIVTASMDLEPKEAEAFWPLYRDYRNAMMRVNDRFAKLLTEFLGQYGSLTDETATRLMDEYSGIERDRTVVKTDYVPKFRAVMAPRKVARFFQVEHKLDTLVEAELAQLIPLAR
jgi:hypothetical protein